MKKSLYKRIATHHANYARRDDYYRANERKAIDRAGRKLTKEACDA